MSLECSPEKTWQHARGASPAEHLVGVAELHHFGGGFGRSGHDVGHGASSEEYQQHRADARKQER